jgi:hypothetical protein
MITVEDLLEKLDELLWTPPCINGEKMEIKTSWDRRFISDVSNYTREGKCLSTSQSVLGIKLIKRYIQHLVVSGFEQNTIETIINSPVHRLQPYQSSNIRREVKYIGDNKLVFRFKYNPSIIDKLREIKHTNPYTGKIYPDFHSDLKLWVLEITIINYEKIMNIISDFKFDFDDDVVEFLMNFTNSKTTKSSAHINNGNIEVVVSGENMLNQLLNNIIELES